MKKFFQEKVMDFKFRKAGEGHKLNEEKPPPSLPKSQPGNSATQVDRGYLQGPMYSIKAKI